MLWDAINAHSMRAAIYDAYTLSSLVPRPAPSFPSLAVRLSGRGPGTFSHVSDVTDRANYANMGVM